MPAGRPSTYSFEICIEICQRVSNGERIKKILASDERYPPFSTWCDWKREHDELSYLYTRSIQDKAESVDDEIDQIMDDVKNGILDSSQGRLIIDTLKWKAGKYYPKMFGDKSAIDLTTKGESLNALTAEQARKKADELDNSY